jgi:hypothetical protein
LDSCKNGASREAAPQSVCAVACYAATIAAKARGKTSFGAAPGVELDNGSVNDGAFIEETWHTDVAGIIGDDTQPDE